MYRKILRKSCQNNFILSMKTLQNFTRSARFKYRKMSNYSQIKMNFVLTCSKQTCLFFVSNISYGTVSIHFRESYKRSIKSNWKALNSFHGGNNIKEMSGSATLPEKNLKFLHWGLNSKLPVCSGITGRS